MVLDKEIILVQEEVVVAIQTVPLQVQAVMDMVVLAVP
jgi:hypothetical protein